MAEFMRADLAAALEAGRRRVQRKASRHVIVAGERHHRVMQLTRDGFVIEADGRPPLRGFVDLMLGEERISRRLVVCAWAADGLVGYDFKRASLGRENTPADWVEPDHSGLLPAPRE